MSSSIPPPFRPNDSQEIPSAECNEENAIEVVQVLDIIESSSEDATIDKPPSHLHLGYGKDDDDDDDDEDEDDNDDMFKTTCSRPFRLSLASNILFLVASLLYVLLSIVDFNYAQSLLVSSDGDDDGSAATTAATAWPSATTATAWPSATMAPSASGSDYYDDDDGYIYVFSTKNGVWVSLYQIIYFLAALFFVLSGIVDFFQWPGLVSVIMIMAGCSGLISAMLMEYYEYMSNVFNMISVHMFMVEAIGLFFRHRRNDSTGGATPQQKRMQAFVLIGSISWIGGTLTDVVMSYFYIRGTGDTVPHAIVSVLSATLWLACSIIYLTATCIQEYQVRKQQRDQAFKATDTASEGSSSSSENNDRDDKDDEMP